MKFKLLLSILLLSSLCFGQETTWEFGVLANHTKTQVENFSDTLNGHATIGIYSTYNLTPRSKVSVGANFHCITMGVERNF